MRLSSLLSLALCLAFARASSLIVQTDSGPVEGTTTATSKVWLGIPFAAAPIGSLRWQPPQPPQPWTAVLNVSRHAPACPQAANVLVPGATTSEDCLFIQVYAPLNSNPNSNLPVYYYIYGGGYRSGSPEKYDGQFMAGTDIITVVAAYRLGPLGFLAHPLVRDLNNLNTTGNYAIQDQRLGMEWVKNNIRAFGGNPDDVTLGGTSAGGGSVCLHLVNPRSQPYFKKVIMESAASCTGLINTAQAYSRGDQFIANLRCNGTDAQKLACMYAATPAQILAASTSGGPVQDPYEITETPFSLAKRGEFKKVPLIMGTQANESAPNYCGAPITTEQQFVTAVTNKYPSTAATLLATYNLTNYPTATAAANAVDSDNAFICPAKGFEDAFSSHYPNIWVYNFDEYPFYATGGIGTRECLGASHTFNLGYSFPSFYISRLPQNPLPSPIFTTAEQELGNKWRAAQAQFIKTGNPQIPAIGRVWPRYSFEEGHYLNVDLGDWWVGTHFKNDYCPAWGIPSSDTSCEDSVVITQTADGSWSTADGVHRQYIVSVTTGNSPVYAAELIIRFNIVPFTNGPFDSLVSVDGVTRNAFGLYEINDWRFQSGRAVPPYTTLNFRYVAKSTGPAVISVGTASCVAPPKDCHVVATLTQDGSWSDGSRFYKAYSFAFTNQGSAETDTVTIKLTLPSGSFPSQEWNLQSTQSQAEILASSTVTYTAPVWGLQPGQTGFASGFILSSPVQSTPKPTFSVTSTTCL